MQERIQAAESEIQKRQRVLSDDHGGMPEEREAIADALKSMRSLQTAAAEWHSRQFSQGDTEPPETG